MSKKKKGTSSNTIALNKKAQHDYYLEQRFEAGLALQGWEVKSMREGRAQLKESYVIFKKGEAFLIGAHLSPLSTTSTHIDADPVRTRKLLLNRRELNKLIGAVQKEGYTVVPVALYWSKNNVKLEIALAKGKKQHDKRETSKKRDWERTKSRIMKSH